MICPALVEIGGAPYYTGAGTLALLLAVAHLCAPRLRRRFGAHAAIVGSLGGGMAAAYVFLHLIPELDKGHELLGSLIFAIPLVGFAVHYTAQRVFGKKEDEEPGRLTFGVGVRLANLAVYNWLIVYGAPELGIEAGWRATTIVVGLFLHLLQADYSFGREFSRPFDSVGRYLLAIAAILGYLAILAGGRTDETINDLLTAFLAGSVLFNVFREEVPDDRESRIGWFFAGILIFAGLVAWAEAGA